MNVKDNSQVEFDSLMYIICYYCSDELKKEIEEAQQQGLFKGSTLNHL